MGNVDYAALADALAQVRRARTIHTFNGRSFLLRLLEKRKGSGKNCSWTWEGTGAIAENYTDGEDVSNYGTNTKNVATLPWAMYRSNFLITDYAASVGVSSVLSGELTDVAKNEFSGSVVKLASTINDESHNGLGTGTLIAGLDLALDDANTYAGVNRSTGSLAGFRAKVIDPGVPTAPTFALLRSDLSSIYDICGEVPPIAVCATSVWNKIASLFTEVRRYTQDVSGGGGRMISLNAGVDAIEIDGCVFVKDKDATANQISYINPEYLRFEYLPFAGQEALMAAMKEMQIDDGYGAIPLGMICKPLAVTGAAQKMTCQVQLQLVCEKPNAMGKRVNVLTT